MEKGGGAARRVNRATCRPRTASWATASYCEPSEWPRIAFRGSETLALRSAAHRGQISSRRTSEKAWARCRQPCPHCLT